MPPGPYRVTTCRGRELNCGSQTYVFDHTRTCRASLDEWSARCRGHLRDSTNMKDNTHKHTPIHTNKANMEWWLRRPNDIRGPCGPKVSRHLSYRWGKTPKKPHPGNLSRPMIEPGPAAWQARMLPLSPQRWTRVVSWAKKLIKNRMWFASRDLDYPILSWEYMKLALDWLNQELHTVMEHQTICS